VNRECGY